MAAHDVHAQASRKRGVLFIGGEVVEAIVNVVHAHDGRRTLGGVDDLGRDVGGGFGLHGGQQLRTAHAIGGSNEAAPLLVVAQLSSTGQRGPVEAEVFGIFGQRFQKCFDRHEFGHTRLSWNENRRGVGAPRLLWILKQNEMTQT